MLALFCLSACASAPYHVNLMSSQQLMSASCEQLAAEEIRVGENAEHKKQASQAGGVAMVFMAILEGVAAVKTGSTLNESNSAAVSTGALADEHSKQAAELTQTKSLISTLRAKKRCT